MIFFGDSGGTFRAYDLAGNPVSTLVTGGFIFSSPAVSGGRVYFADAGTGMLLALG